MKILASVPLVAAFSLAALAGEVPLLPRDLDLLSPRSYGGDVICWERAVRPDKATAPDGELRWGLLHAGTVAHWACFSPEGKGALYYDADGDLDLREEKPIRPTGPGPEGRVFSVPGVQGEFKAGDSTVPAVATIEFDSSFSEETGMLLVATVYEGRASADGVECAVEWIPGEALRLRMPSKALDDVPARTMYAGDRRIALRNSLASRDGRLFATFDAGKEEGMVQAAAPPDAFCTVLMEGREDAPRGTLLLPSGGKFFFPRGDPREAVLVLRKADASGTFYELLVQLGAVKAAEGLSLGDPAPLAYTIDVLRDGPAMKFRFACRDAAGREIYLCRNGVPADLPILEVIGPDGAVLAKHQYEAG
jgi:hypothetical protein